MSNKIYLFFGELRCLIMSLTIGVTLIACTSPKIKQESSYSVQGENGGIKACVPLKAKINKALKMLLLGTGNFTLKLKIEDGDHLRYYVKATGIPASIDPRQDCVFEGFANSYYWLFRKEAGDLHPAFLLPIFMGFKPEQANMPSRHSKKMGFNPLIVDGLDQIVSSSLFATDYYEASKAFVRYLILERYLQQVPRSGALSDLMIVSPSQFKNYSENKDKIVSRLILILKSYKSLNKKGDQFVTNRALSVYNQTKKEMEIRLDPVIKPVSGKFTLSQEVLASIGVSLPAVTTESGGSIQCLDHHRIQAAYELDMAIQVAFLPDFKTFN